MAGNQLILSRSGRDSSLLLRMGRGPGRKKGQALDGGWFEMLLPPVARLIALDT